MNVAPVQSPRSFRVDILNLKTLELTWDPPEEGFQNGLIRQYVVSITTIDTQQVDSHAVDGSTRRLPVNNLHPSYTYNCTVRAVTVARGPPANAIIKLPEDSKLIVEIPLLG